MLGWVREHGLSVGDELSYLREYEHVTLARVLIAGSGGRGAGSGTLPEVTQFLVRRQTAAQQEARAAGKAGKRGLIEPLSERELDVLRLLASDLDGPDIARQLFVSLSTVRTHTQRIYAKLGVNNRRSAIRVAEELNLLSRSADR